MHQQTGYDVFRRISAIKAGKGGLKATIIHILLIQEPEQCGGFYRSRPSL
jgi:hypothetical protein